MFTGTAVTDTLQWRVSGFTTFRQLQLPSKVCVLEACLLSRNARWATTGRPDWRCVQADLVGYCTQVQLRPMETMLSVALAAKL